jgi:uncharacterized membrane protein
MTSSMDTIVKQGRFLFAIAILAFGIENLVCARFGQAVVPVIPWVTRPIFAYLVGASFIAAAISIAANKMARLATILLGLLLFLCLLVFQLSREIAAPFDLGIRTIVFETLSMCAAAWMLAGTLPAENRYSSFWEAVEDKLIKSGRYLFAISSVIFGIAHFLIPRFIASLIPTWIPGALFWAYFTGAAFVATGLSLAAAGFSPATNRIARWASALLGVMFLLWVFCLHAPRVMSFPKSHNPDEWSSAFIALGMCGVSWISAWALSTQALRNESPARHQQALYESPSSSVQI